MDKICNPCGASHQWDNHLVFGLTISVFYLWNPEKGGNKMRNNHPAIFSMAACAAIPATNIKAWPRKAPTVLVDGEMMAFAHTLRKLEMPYSWYMIPKRPTSHTKSAGICNILIASANRAHQVIHKPSLNKFFITCERLGRAHHFSEPANGDEKSGREVAQ